ncbi:MAG: hypothetical protein NZ908_03185 [Candidatus Micrarchaeota archaeon]|nr:hypothetical protein [Candidatus Micrarchaeota archaeon]MCX8154351.1 hypothetical protein [Candidatus Micrarchaeota archaeon]
MQRRQFQMPTSSGFLQFSIGEELSGYKIDVKTALIVIVLSVIIIKILGLILQ